MIYLICCFWYFSYPDHISLKKEKTGGLFKMHVTHGSGRGQGLPGIDCLGTSCLDVLGPGYSRLGNYPNFLKMCENILSNSYQFP